MSALQGLRVVVTRPRPAAEELARELIARGAHPILLPTIIRDRAEGLADLAPALLALRPGDWVVVTSPFAADLIGATLGSGPAAAAALGVRVAAVGAETATALARHRITVSAIPSEPRGEAIAAALGDLRGRRALLPGSAIARPETAAALLRLGAEVRSLAVYHTDAAPPDPAALRELHRGVDAVLFTSPSTVRGFLAAVGADARALLVTAAAVCIGPTTARAAREEGLDRVVIAPHPSQAGLLEALDHSFSSTERTLA